MALVTPAALLNMEYAFGAEPFLNQPAKSSIELFNMEYAFQAQPFIGNEGGGTVATPRENMISSKLIAEGLI